MMMMMMVAQPEAALNNMTFWDWEFHELDRTLFSSGVANTPVNQFLFFSHLSGDFSLPAGHLVILNSTKSQGNDPRVATNR